MNHLAQKLDDGVVHQEIGSVLHAAGDRLRVATPAGKRDARRAVSCLVAPVTGDEVIVATSARGRTWVLAVLERTEGAGATLTADGDLDVRLPAGRFAVAAAEGVALTSTETVSVTSRSVEVRALDGRVVIDRLTHFGRYLQAEVGKIKTVASTLDAVVERLSQRVKRSYRTVEQYDQVRARQIDYRAERTMNLRSENAVVTAEHLVKLDGEQIHVG